MSSAASIENPAAYVQRMRRLLGDRDPLSVLSATPDKLADIVRAHTPTQLQAKPFEGKRD